MLLTGFVIIIPFVVLIFLFDMAFRFVRGALEPVIRVLRWAGVIRMANFGFLGDLLIEIGFYRDVYGVFTELVAVIVLIGLIVVLGVFGSFRVGEATVEYIDGRISRIPGIGSIYRSLRRMGDIVLETGLENFQSVKLVEFPDEDLYSLAFETNRAPDSVSAATDNEDMATMFVPLAPNPVMGGFLVHVPRERVIDVDMTVEQAARSIVTSGIAAGDVDHADKPSLNPFQRVREGVSFRDHTGVAIERDDLHDVDQGSPDQSDRE